MPALATERLIVPISPSGKKAVAKKAASRHMSMAEYVRRAVLRDDPPDLEQQEEAELRALLEVFAATHAQTIEQLGRTDRALDAVIAHFAAKKTQ
jgi:hypothetical protein